ncbi:MAG: biotin transporter BioY [Lachnospiraceae bacterium]
MWFVVQTQSTIAYALTACVFPFIPFDLIKITIAILLGKAVRKRLPSI